MNARKGLILKELLISDAFIHYFLGSFFLLILLPLFHVPPSLNLILMCFFGAVGLVCLPFVIYRIGKALCLVKNGVEIRVKGVSFESVRFGTKLRFEYEYADKKYHKTKFVQTFWFPDKTEPPMKLLVDPKNPSIYAILELKKRSVFTIVRNRNK